MKAPSIFSMLVVAILLVAGVNVSAASTSKEPVEGVDWKAQVITVTGEGIVPPNAVNYAQAKRLAATAAKADAYRKLGEMINGVRVEAQTTVEEMLTTSDVIKMRVSATIKGAKIVNEGFLSDGAYRVVMQVPMFGVTNSLASAVFDRTTTIEPFPTPVAEVEPSGLQYNVNPAPKSQTEMTTYGSPLARKALPTLDTIILQEVQANTFAVQEPTYQSNNGTSMATPNTRKSVADYASMAEGDYTGLIVDCRGLDLQPVMSPVILNSNGTKIYGHKNLDIDKVISMGMADYIDDTEHVERAGTNPLVVKAVAVQNFNSNPVLAIPDSNRVLIENYATKFLKDLKVVFLFDSF